MLKFLSYSFSFLFILSTGCTKHLFKKAAKSYEKGIQGQPYDAIIVTGFPYNGEKWDRVVQMRVYWAKYLYDRGYTGKIMFSGSAVATPYIESRVMAKYAAALGIPEKDIFTEEKAEHSTENVYYSYRLLKDKGYKKIALATDPFQNHYMEKFVRKYELPIAFLPTVLDTLRTLDTLEPKIDLDNTVKKDFVKLSDREGFFKRFKGTMGKYIVWHEEDLKKKKYRRRYKDRMIP